MAQPNLHSTEADGTADMDVDRIRLFRRHDCTPSLGDETTRAKGQRFALPAIG
ncbi:hypothetical protein [Methyloligella halotolerans]|uniref:hypothetical protein n=1 Tax=Methyloligella halotolerans TaxID=1177755 RepID=UPI0014721014|nr:hypothetical protein [Methyloligella halotolerans]